MKNRDALIDKLGNALHVAARNSVASGAMYNPDEDLTTHDPKVIWRGVADAIVNIVEAAVREHRELESND